jgi:cytochrome oxidase Cu insertion factor (SCO1/SenC/PrrC family)
MIYGMTFGFMKKGLMMRNQGFLWLPLVAAVLALAPGLGYAQGQPAPASMTGSVAVGDKAPDFELKDQNGKTFTLSEYVKEKGTVALVFHRSADW